MNKAIAFIIGFLCVGTGAFSHQRGEAIPQSYTYKVKGKISGIKTGTSIRLLYRLSKFRTDTLGTAAIKGGRFELKITPAMITRNGQQLVKVGTHESPGTKELAGMLCYLAIDSVQQELPLFLDPDGIAVKSTARDWPDASVSGSAINSDFLVFKKQLIDKYPYFDTLFFPEPEKVYAELVERASDIYKAEGNGERFREWADRYQIYTEALIGFVEHHPDAAFSAFLLSGSRSYDVQRINARSNFSALYNGLTEKAMDSFYGRLLSFTKASMEHEDSYDFIGIGDSAPAINQLDLNGKPFSLQELLSEYGKCVLIDFWESSCAACRKKMPFYKQLLNEFGDRGFSVVAYAHDKDERIWKNAIAKDGTWAFHHLGAVQDPEKSVVSNYKSSVAYPGFLIDSDGTIIAKSLNEIDLFLTISGMLSEKSSK
ncbi:redoxin domain-containing protein [Parapedobacter deserti]|uniref:Redoxin domain-containing protein n=1 Tax=Parapedobacter deserti TaxID=1912957 RepID=A0ABV7JS79_9SPHI